MEDETKGPERILVFRIGHLGDTVVGLPAFWTLRHAFPEAYIAYLSNPRSENKPTIPSSAVLPAEGLFDEFLTYDPSLPFGLFRTIRMLRRYRFQRLYYLMTRIRTERQIFRDELFFKACGIGRIVGTGYLRANPIPPFGRTPLPAVKREAEFLLDLLADDGIDISNSGGPGQQMLALTAQERDAADAFLKSAGASGGSPLIGVGPGSKWESKIWAETRFIEVISRLVELFDVFPIVFGGKEDRIKGDRILRAVGRGANAAGSLKVREAGAALEKCALYLGNDTGTMHLAAAAGTRCVTPFASIDFPGRWEPFGEGHLNFRKSVPCEGCHTEFCHNDHLCLDGLDADLIGKACESILRSADE